MNDSPFFSSEDAEPFRPEPSPAEESRRLFCPKCGNRLPQEGGQCPLCDRPVPIAGPLRTYVGDVRRPVGAAAIVPPILFYFCLLVPFLLVAVIFSDNVLTMELAGSWVTVVVVLLFALGSFRDSFSGFLKIGPVKYLVLAVVGAGVTFLAAEALITVLIYLGMEELSYAEPFLEGGYRWRHVVFYIAVLPGFFEELGFRGYLQSALKKFLSPREALILTGCLFAILHMQFAMIPFLVLLGIYLGWLREKSGSLYPCILAHFSHNLLVVLAEYYRAY